MAEHDALVLAYSHLADFPRAKEALHTLKKVASLVKPIMRARGWTVRELAEFYPDQANLLGLNVNRGQRILLRLRYPGDRNQFVRIEQVVDTMLHELSHIVHGPHDGKFHALWNQLREEHEGLVMKGYTGEGFLSEGQRLGGGRLPMHEARRVARVAAEKRRVLSKGSGQRLGGSAPRPGQDIRGVIVGAVDRRNRALQGCGNTNHNEREIQEISDTATKNGFKTQAEEDAANEAAIAQALWELVQEEERQKYGNYYIPPSAQNPTGNGGGSVMGEESGSRDAPPISWNPPPVPPPVSRPVSRPPPIPKPETRPPKPSPSTSGSYQQQRPRPAPQSNRGWTCSICTLHNESTHLCCDACGVEKGEDPNRQVWSPSGSMSQQASVIDLTKSSSSSSSQKKKEKERTIQTAPQPQTWQCSFCGTRMDRQWWTCSTCGVMKDASR